MLNVTHPLRIQLSRIQLMVIQLSRIRHTKEEQP
jgi:hypothetical protein